MLRFRLILAWLVMAALPLQGWAAASMLFCGPAQKAAVHAKAHSLHEGVSHHHAQAAHDGMDGAQAHHAMADGAGADGPQPAGDKVQTCRR